MSGAGFLLAGSLPAGSSAETEAQHLIPGQQPGVGRATCHEHPETRLSTFKPHIQL